MELDLNPTLTAPEQLKREAALAGLLYFESVRNMYMVFAETELAITTLVLGESGSALASMESILRLYLKADIHASSTMLLRRLLTHYDILPPANVTLRKEYRSLLLQLSERSQYTEQDSLTMMRYLIRLASYKSLTDQLRKIPSIDKSNEVLNQYQQQMSKLDGNYRMRLYNPIRDIDELMLHQERVPTGIGFIDRLTGGGLVFGQHLGILGPSGGGKTVISIQLMCNLAIQGHNVLYLQFEQPVKGDPDIVSRIYSYLSGEPITTFYGKTTKELNPEVLNKLRKMQPISDRIRCASMLDVKEEGGHATGAGSIQDIINVIDEAIRSGFTPKVVIIDWLGAAVSDFMNAGDGGDQNYPIVAEHIQDVLNGYGKDHGISIVYSHQTSTEAQARESAYKPKKGDAYYFRAFANKLETCMQIGTATLQPDETQVCYLVIGKARGAVPNKSIVVRINGRMARMEETKEGEYIPGHGGKLQRLSSLVQTNEPKETELGTDVSKLDEFSANYGR